MLDSIITKIYFMFPYALFFRLMTTYAVAEISEQQIRDRPLELGDIMPEDRRLYDKMRPPKYKGKNVLFLCKIVETI